MEILKLVKALNNQTRRKIIQLLCHKDMTAVELYKKLGDEAPKYRQSINKSLEILKESGIIHKYYSDKDKKLYYHMQYKKIIIDLEKMQIVKV